jgi:hypothetical protein
MKRCANKLFINIQENEEENLIVNGLGWLYVSPGARIEGCL